MCHGVVFWILVFFVLCGGNPVGRFADVTLYTFLRSFSRRLHFRFVYKNYLLMPCGIFVLGLSDVLGYMFAVDCNSTYCARSQNVSFLEISG